MDDLLMTVFADLESPAPDPGSWRPKGPPFACTLELFRHFGSGKRLLKAVVGGQSGALARREAHRWLEGLVRAELNRLGVMRRHHPWKVDTVVSFEVGSFLGFMEWWIREENEHLPPEAVDDVLRSLVLPGGTGALRIESPS
jgi:hypothetical protein